ncbi:M4 family metallopeptidase [Goodfellowiella coeruleoviolacea]|uniref:Neutral metalloproteinase n=1 Tax=Goodfellowiella coeruleoviolacea TaxID=334858 RepID=A0AAE3GEM8_9PSEU|nr:M4 family metallopeptidase [Goodfellowiella coeruleoviolacea]MCP2166816.1 Zn-dependent metalloprotease [Goodfellowiella coeruleoviolacea]
MRLPALALTPLVAVGALTVPLTAASAAPPEQPGNTAAGQAGLLVGGPGQAFTERRTETDADGTSHVHLDRTYRGLPVLGGDVIVRRGPGGTAPTAATALTAPLELATTPRLAAASAGRIALDRAGDLVGRQASGAPSLVVEALGDDAASRVPTLAWDVLVTGSRPDGTPSRLHVLVDATTGAVTTSYDEVQADTGRGFHSGEVELTTAAAASNPGQRVLRDPSRNDVVTYDYSGGNGGWPFLDSDGVWGNGLASNSQTAAVDIQWGTATTFDFYRDTFGHTLLDNRGDPPSSFRELYARAHEGDNLANAYWDSYCNCMSFGDGNTRTHGYNSLDVVAHEATHAVIHRSARLNYAGEAGGLNEATADIVGNLVEFYAANPNDPPDYLVGEKVWKAGPLRFMDQPSKDGKSVDCWSAGVGNLDVHRSSGVGNHAFYLLANGSGTSTWGTSPTCDGATVTGIGRDAAARIWFRALTRHWTSTTNYAEARAGMLAAATELYGQCGTEYRAVQAAWSGVAVPGADAACPLP